MTKERKKLFATEVAKLLGVRYLKARDLMFTKKFGDVMADPKTGKDQVYEDLVLQYQTQPKARRVGV